MNRFISKELFFNRIFRHILYWIGLIVFFGITWGTYDNDYVRSFTIQTFSLPARMLLVYVSIYILIPTFFIKRKFIEFTATYIILLLVTSILLQRSIMLFYVQPHYLSDWESKGYFTVTELVNTILDVNIAAVIPLGFSFFRFYYNAQQRTLTLEKQKIEAELTQLRNQVHPHFLFNTLNNLYALIIKKSDAAETAILKLSSLMRYMLYESNADQVSLKKEIEYLKNYIDLEKLRFDTNVDIQFTNEVDQEYEIAPFLLIPFVENSFKHGTNSTKKSWIVITISAIQNKLIMTTENTKRHGRNEASVGGIGTQNVTKRLAMLYPNNYSLNIENKELSYKVTLSIGLNKISKDVY